MTLINNMASIYGGQGRYKEAYDCFFKAHELNKSKPNPVYGLALCCRDLNRPEECIKWCEEYTYISTDNRLDDLYEKTRLDLGIKKTEEIVKTMSDYEIIQEGDGWSIVKDNDYYCFIDEKKQYATTPRGSILQTDCIELAKRILEDLVDFGLDDYSPDNILPWHYTLLEKFSKMDHRKVEEILIDSFVNQYDWTYNVDISETSLKNIWGKRGIRELEIMAWLSKITHMQMTAACCIGNAYHSINISYMLATIMEKYKGDEREKVFNDLADFVGKHSKYFVNVDDFKNFEFYYGVCSDNNENVII